MSDTTPEDIKRIHPDDPEWECGKKVAGHVCIEYHNKTGVTAHKCCCGATWEDDPIWE